MAAYSDSHQREANKTLSQLGGAVTAASNEQRNKTEEAMNARNECLRANDSYSDACSGLNAATESAVDATFSRAQVTSQYQTAAFTLNSDQQFNSFLNARVSSLQQELIELDDELKHADPYLGPIADSRNFQDLHDVLNATEQSLDDEWLQFEYDSDSSHESTSQDTTSVIVVIGLSYNSPIPHGLSAGGTLNVGYSHTDLSQAISSASVKVSGELLRVTIKRPWFKPGIFDDTSLSFVSVVACT